MEFKLLMLLAVSLNLPESHQIPIETEVEEILDAQGFEYRRPDFTRNEYQDFVENLYRYDLVKSRSAPERFKRDADNLENERFARSNGRDHNPIIENPNTKGRDDFQDFRTFQSNLNKNQAVKSGPGIRFKRNAEDEEQEIYENLEDSLRRIVRSNGRDHNPIIENSNTKGRDDFQDFRRFQSNLNKNQDSKGTEFRLIREANEEQKRNTRDLGDKFSPIIQNSAGEHIMRDSYSDYRNFQADLNRRDQLRSQTQAPKSKRSLDDLPELSRVKRMLMFRPLFVYKNQQYKRKRVVKNVPKTV